MPTPSLKPPAGLAEPDNAAECRVRERHPCGLPGACQPIAARADRDFLWQGTMRDLSASGVGLVLERRYEPGANLTIETADNTLVVRVVHVQPRPDGQWLLGCAFLDELPADELQSLLHQGAAAERGQAPRRASVTLDRLVAEVNPGTETPGGRRRDSKNFQVIPNVLFRWAYADARAAPVLALRLLLKDPWPVDAGAQLRVRLTDRGEATLHVVACCRDAGRWELCYTLPEQPGVDLAAALGLEADIR